MYFPYMLWTNPFYSWGRIVQWLQMTVVHNTSDPILYWVQDNTQNERKQATFSRQTRESANAYDRGDCNMLGQTNTVIFPYYLLYWSKRPDTGVVIAV